MVRESIRVPCPACSGSGRAARYGACGLCQGDREIEHYVMREPCRFCQGGDGALVMDGAIRKVNGQNIVRCLKCHAAVYTAPKFETGETNEKPTSRKRSDQSKRARILERDNGRCVLCGRGGPEGVILDVCHILSVADYDAMKGRGVDMADIDVNDDYNLFAGCQDCNQGQWRSSMNPLMYARLLQARVLRVTNG